MEVSCRKLVVCVIPNWLRWENQHRILELHVLELYNTLHFAHLYCIYDREASIVVTLTPTARNNWVDDSPQCGRPCQHSPIYMLTEKQVLLLSM